MKKRAISPESPLSRNEPIYVAGHGGLVGSAVCRLLQARGFNHVITRSRAELDLRDRGAVCSFFHQTRPHAVIMAAAKVGGIQANNAAPAEFLLENLEIQNNVIRAAHEARVDRLVFLGSSCIYPKYAPQPIPESALMTGPLEPTNEAYAVAKIAGIKLCQSYAREYGSRFISLMPTNLYGPGDNFDLDTSHVLAALVRKTHEAKISGEPSVTVWGTGEPRREFLHVDDLAEAILYLLEHYDSPEIINVGYGEDISIRELAQLVSELIGFAGELRFDRSKPDGTPRKLLDTSKIAALGWRPRISLRAGIAQTYEWFQTVFAPSVLAGR